MKKLILLPFILLTLSACDSSVEHSFYMTNNGEEITQVTCGMTDVQVRVDVSSLKDYTNGDLIVRFEMTEDGLTTMGEGTGDLYVASTDIPEDKLLWIDANPTTSKVQNFATNKPFDIFYGCSANGSPGMNNAKIKITYFEPSDAGEKKVGYQDEIWVMN